MEKRIVRQRRERGCYDRETACEVLDAGLVAHVGFVDEGEPAATPMVTPIVIPMLYARDGDRLLMHGGVGSRLLRRLSAGVSVCVTVTHLDGLVLAASVFEHSANYRSIVIFGQARLIEEPEEKAQALDRIVEFMMPGRGRDARSGSPKEVNATTVIAVPIETFSVKRREGGAGEPGPNDPRNVWTGVLPISQTVGSPIADREYDFIPDYIKRYTIE